MLLAKIGRTNAPFRKRRKVDPNGRVLTSSEYLALIKEKEANRKPKDKNKRKTKVKPKTKKLSKLKIKKNTVCLGLYKKIAVQNFFKTKLV